MVVKHDHVAQEETKMDGKPQHNYPRKNWSSLVLWNLSHPAHDRLIKEDGANKWEPGYLHRFGWVEDDDIGEIPETWNWLVDVSPTTENGKNLMKAVSINEANMAENAPGNGIGLSFNMRNQIKAAHFTLGTPDMPGRQNCEFSGEWRRCLNGRDRSNIVIS